MLKTLLDLKQALYKPLRGHASRIIKQDNLLKQNKIEHAEAGITINENLK